MLCLSTPAAPSLTRTFSQAASSVAGAYTLSIRLYQRPPLTPFSSADTMRSVQTEASTHDQSRASAPCVALAGTADALACSLPDIPSPTTSRARTSRAYHLVRPIGPLRVQASPHMSRLAATCRRIGFVILRAVRSPPAAPHPVSERRLYSAPRRRSCLRLHMR